MGLGVDAVVHGPAALKKLLRDERDEDGGAGRGKAPLDVDMVLPQGEGGHKALLLLVVQPHQGAVILLRHASGPEYLVAQLPLGVGHVQDKERHHEKAFVPGLQFGQKLLGVRAVGGKVGGQDVHVVAGAHRLFLLLYLHGVQVGDLPLYPLDGLGLLNGLHM